MFRCTGCTMNNPQRCHSHASLKTVSLEVVQHSDLTSRLRPGSHVTVCSHKPFSLCLSVVDQTPPCCHWTTFCFLWGRSGSYPQNMFHTTPRAVHRASQFCICVTKMLTHDDSESKDGWQTASPSLLGVPEVRMSILRAP